VTESKKPTGQQVITESTNTSQSKIDLIASQMR